VSTGVSNEMHFVTVIHGRWRPWIVGQDWTAAAETVEVTHCQVAEQGHTHL